MKNSCLACQTPNKGGLASHERLQVLMWMEKGVR